MLLLYIDDDLKFNVYMCLYQWLCKYINHASVKEGKHQDWDSNIENYHIFVWNSKKHYISTDNIPTQQIFKGRSEVVAEGKGRNYGRGHSDEETERLLLQANVRHRGL